LADPSGMLPASLTIASGAIGARDGTLGPETVYQLLPLDRLVPREIPLSASVGAGLSLWTAARPVTPDLSGGVAQIALTVPIGVPHYFLVQGLGSFTQIQLHGIPWHSDPTFYRYSDGWAFDDASGTLSMKITQRLPQETVLIRF
jgi:hypothetical protein